jgi:hypothetical protein
MHNGVSNHPSERGRQLPRKLLIRISEKPASTSMGN